jgi:tetratricopeptide (TPR) repeat protein
MKYLFVLVSTFVYSFANAQNLKNTEWIKIKAQRKDGSRIVDRTNRGIGCLHYLFTADTVHMSSDIQYAAQQNYFFDDDSTISFGNLVNYHIDSLNDVFLGVTELPKAALSDDKINNYVFINADYIYDYMVKTNELTLSADSMIEYNDYFFPAYEGQLNALFVNKFDYPQEDKSLKGSLIISGNGMVRTVSITSVKNFSDKQIKEVANILNSSSGSWIMPPSPKLFQFRLNFFLMITRTFNGNLTSFSFSTKDTVPKLKSLSNVEKDELAIHFNSGRRLFKNGKFDKAVAQFLTCIKIDETNLDAYYDLAYSYQKLGNIELACETWKKLKEMGQNEGNMLYNANCK